MPLRADVPPDQRDEILDRLEHRHPLLLVLDDREARAGWHLERDRTIGPVVEQILDHVFDVERAAVVAIDRLILDPTIGELGHDDIARCDRAGLVSQVKRVDLAVEDLDPIAAANRDILGHDRNVDLELATEREIPADPRAADIGRGVVIVVAPEQRDRSILPR